MKITKLICYWSGVLINPSNNFGHCQRTMRTDESADEAALRLVREKIGLKLASFHTESPATFTHPERTPGQRTLFTRLHDFLPECPI